VLIKEYSDFDSDDEDDIRAWEKMEETLENYRRDNMSAGSAESGNAQLSHRLRKATKSHAESVLDGLDQTSSDLGTGPPVLIWELVQ
jgi:hypothetical protein